jgi:uncharacterized membrane protein YfcA
MSRPALVVGVLAGLLSGLFGVGGGLIIVPGLMIGLHVERRLAHGTSLVATIPIAAASLVTYAVADEVDWAVAGCLIGGSLAGAVLGTRLLHTIPKRPLTIIFIVTILATAARLALSGDTPGRGDIDLLAVAGLVAVGFVAGTLAGLLGIGGGVVMVPAMVVGFSMPPVLAKGTSVAVIVPTSTVGTMRNRKNANADLRIGFQVGAAGVVSAVVGGIVSTRIDDTVANVTFALLLFVVAITQALTLRDAGH